MPSKKKKRHLKIGNILLLLVIVIALIGGITFARYNSSLKAVSNESEQVSFTIPSGSSTRSVTENLEEQGIIQNATFAYIFARQNNLTDVKAGDYILDKSWDVEEILTILNNPTSAITDDVSVTIIEGDWAKHIAQKIGESTSVTEEELLALWNDESYIRSLMDTYPFLTEEMFQEDVRIYLEGYLAPETYFFHRETTADEVTRKMLDQSLAVYRTYESEISSSSLSIHELYTLASIIQYESGKIDDMKMIAGVFYNRMNINMPLQSSVTVCYAIDINKDDDWMNCEVNSTYDSPYNTYQNLGLPPGPIENAGRDAFEAVLNPTDSDYYYFMADVYGDGTVYYAKTLAEHEENVRKYLQ